MSDQDQNVEAVDTIDNTSDNDNTDAWAALFAVLIVVAGMIYWVSQQ